MAQEPREVRRGPYANEIAEALYQARAMPIAELGRRIALKREYVSDIVNGWRLPSAEQLDRIVEVLGWSAEQLYPTEEFRTAIEATRRAEEPA